MDPILNPYAPGAGTQPPELAGRDELRKNALNSLRRVKAGRSGKSIVMVGLRGVGKTVLLDRIREDAEHTGFYTMHIEASEYRSLPSMIAPQLRSTLIKLSRREKSKELAETGLKALASFVSALKTSYHDIEVVLDFSPEPGLADSTELESDLRDLFVAVGNAARADGNCLALFLDEIQYVKENELTALISTLNFIAQRNLPIAVVAAGLPQVLGRLGKAKSYAERMFDFPHVGALQPKDARTAVEKPAMQAGVEFESDAIEEIVSRTEGYPYFLQVWGKYSWDVADESPITHDVVDRASELAVAELDDGFFLVRFDRMTVSEKRYVRAMAELGSGPHRSGDIANQLGREVTSLAPTRSQLIAKGMIWSPAHGDTVFTVPMFDQFMIRIMPEAPT